MTNSDSIFDDAKELMRNGKQKEAIELLRQAAALGHMQAFQVVQQIDYNTNLTKEFPTNPLCIVNKDNLNKQHIIKNLVPLYEKDILSNLSRLQTLNNGLIPEEITELLLYFTLDNLIEYKNKSFNILPLGVIDQVKDQISEAFENVYIDRGHKDEIIKDYELELKIWIWKEDIIEKTQSFMEKLDNNHFMKT